MSTGEDAKEVVGVPLCAIIDAPIDRVCEVDTYLLWRKKLVSYCVLGGKLGRLHRHIEALMNLPHRREEFGMQ